MVGPQTIPRGAGMFGVVIVGALTTATGFFNDQYGTDTRPLVSSNYACDAPALRIRKNDAERVHDWTAAVRPFPVAIALASLPLVERLPPPPPSRAAGAWLPSTLGAPRTRRPVRSRPGAKT